MRMTLLLAGALALAFALAVVVRPRTPSVAAEPVAALADGAQALAENSPALEAQAATIQGELLEALPANNYTYLRLRTSQGEVWAAVPATTLAPHGQVTIANAARMTDFKSPTLKRTFPAIYFGTLGNAAATSPPGPAVADSDALPAGHPDIDSEGPGPFGAPAHGSPPSASDALLPPPPAERAAGVTGHSIAELSAQRSALIGQKVRVHAQVSKVTDLKGQAFFHVRDASLDASGHAVDLVVTSDSTPTRGDVATFEGTLRSEVDVGIGYKYPLLLENATRLAH